MADLVVGGIVVLILIPVIRKLFFNKDKNGGGGCGCGCGR